jgi:hypothetical protein
MMYDCIWDWTAYTSIGERFSMVFMYHYSVFTCSHPCRSTGDATLSIRPLVQIVFFEILIRPTAVDSSIAKQFALSLDGVPVGPLVM